MSQLISNPAPLRVITASLNDMPNRLRLLAAADLTEPAFYRNLMFPKLRRLADAFAVPHTAKIAAFSTSATSAPLGCRYISAEQRPASVRTGGLLSAGERCSVFFCTL